MSGNYLDCISPQELDRLGAQHKAWSPETHSFLRDMGFSALKRIADYGCGPGFTALDIASTIAPQAEVTALDVSDYYLNHVRRRIADERIANLRVEQQNSALPKGLSARFDGAFCRWFLAWVTKDIDAVLANIYDSLEPGGVFAAMEYLTLKSVVHSPPCAAVGSYLRAWEAFYAETGGTTEVGAMLPGKFAAAGFRIKEIRCVGGLARQGHPHFEWWKRLYEEFVDRLQEKKLLTADEVSELNTYWSVEISNEHAFIYSPTIVQIAAVKV